MTASFDFIRALIFHFKWFSLGGMRAVLMGLVSAVLFWQAGAAAQVTTYWHGPRNERVVALSFDDVPHEPYTSQVLDILERYQIHATFFVIGRHARKWPDIARKILDKGHEIGNHTQNHLNLSDTSPAVIRREIGVVQEWISSELDIEPRMFRPPQGRISFEVLAAVDSYGMDMVLWDVDPQDWDAPGVMDIARRVADQVRPGSILLLHTLNRQIVETLPVLIEYLHLEDYRFKRVSELLDIDPYQPKRPRETALSSDTEPAPKLADKNL